MTAITKSSIFIIFITCILSACNSEFSKDVNGSFGILGTELENKTMFLIDEINIKISINRKIPIGINKKIAVLKPIYDSLSTMKINRYHKLTKEYVAFLSDVEDQFINSYKNTLFQNNEMTKKGEEYVGRARLYSQEIKKLWINQFTKNKVSIALSTDYIQNMEGTKISHIAYYFDDLPIKGIIVYLKQKKHTILALEKDFLNDLIFQNLTAN
jgi:hypothetical protein